MELQLTGLLCTHRHFPAGTTFCRELCELAETRPGQVARFLLLFNLTPADPVVLGAAQQGTHRNERKLVAVPSQELAPPDLWERARKEKRFREGPLVVRS